MSDCDVSKAENQYDYRERIEKRAKWEACWGGEFVYMCEEHLRKLMAIGRAMGVPVQFKPHTGVEICKKCKREVTS